MFIKVMGLQIFLKEIIPFLLLVCIVNLTILQKDQSDLDVELEDNLEDKQYLETLKKYLLYLNEENFDFVFYIAGVDIHHEDRLGKLNITDEGIKTRDQIVINNFYKKEYHYVECLEEVIIKILIN